MDKFAVYHSILNIQSLVKQYPAAEDIAQELNELAQQLSTRTYRVAVVGEFKRGKSSLVNCILGTEILPTDILPATAVVNRVVYGTEQRIEICYKNGEVQRTTVEELAEYATKKNLDNAAKIREIIVHYPSVFCQNNIEILDTPGLNDDEFMDKTTLDVLDKIDTAIVTTHASYPISITEQKLICKLIEQEDIYHLTMVATFIDQVSDEAEEQDRIVDLIRSRLSADTYQLFCRKHPDDPKLQAKARRILCEPVVFAVSSRLAMRGFVTGNKKMLDESRFPHFKYELSAWLTANQELDLQRKAARLARVAKENYPSWQTQLQEKIEQDLTQSKQTLQVSQTYQKTGCRGLTDQLIALDQKIENAGICVADQSQYRKSPIVMESTRIILRNLLQLDPKTVDRAQVEQALRQAGAECSTYENNSTKDWLTGQMQRVNNYMLDSEKTCGLAPEVLGKRLSRWLQETPFPQLGKEAHDFCRIVDANGALERIRRDNCVELTNWVYGLVAVKTFESYQSMQKQIQSYIASWRSQLLKQNLEDKERAMALAEQSAAEVRRLLQLRETVKVNYSANLAQLERAAAELTIE